MLTFAFALALQTQPIDDLLRAFGDESVEVRSKAVDAVLARWKTWSEADLAKLKGVTASKDSEVSAQTRECLETILFYRGIPENVWKAFPNAGPALRRGDADTVADFLDLLKDKWEKRELKSAEVLPLLMGPIEDARETRRTYLMRRGGEGHLQVKLVACTLLHEIVPRLYYNTKADVVRQWWNEHRSRPERDWFLPDLAEKDERLRGGAIQRLFALEDPVLHPKLFDALKTVEEEYSFEIAVRDAARLPKETIRREFAPYLKDPRLEVRFVSAKLTLPFDRRAAIDCLADAIEDPKPLKYGSVQVTRLHEIITWLGETKDDRVFSVLRKFLKSGDYHPRETALTSLACTDDPRVDGILIESFADTDRTSGMEWWGDVVNPRLCDVAGIHLARRLKLQEGRFVWGENIEARDRNLAEIWKVYREKTGLPPAPFVPPGTTPVAPEKVAELIPDLSSGDEGRRKAALKKLSQLGGGAWPHLKAGIEGAQGPARTRLEEAALAYSNTLRSVEGNDPAADRVTRLLVRLHEPFDPDAFFKEIAEPWFGDADLSSLRAEITRQPGGRGITVKIEVNKKDPKSGPPDGLAALTGGGGFGASLRKDVFDDAWKKFLDPLREDMRTGSEKTFKSAMEMRKTNSKER